MPIRQPTPLAQQGLHIGQAVNGISQRVFLGRVIVERRPFKQYHYARYPSVPSVHEAVIIQLEWRLSSSPAFIVCRPQQISIN
jgi:hypothetical protein